MIEKVVIDLGRYRHFRHRFAMKEKLGLLQHYDVVMSIALLSQCAIHLH